MGIGFERKQFLRYAGNFAQKQQISFNNGRPSLKWWGGLKKRHRRLRLRQSEGTAAIRHQCMDHARFKNIFGRLKSIMDASNFHVKPASIWNMDETGVQLDHKPGKIVAERGSKYLHSRTSGNPETITIIWCVNAAGHCLPLLYAFIERTPKRYETEGIFSHGSIFFKKFNMEERCRFCRRMYQGKNRSSSLARHLK